MVFHLARKEFLNNLVSARFVIGFLLCLVLIPFSILINVSRYREKTAQFRIDSAAAETSVREVRVVSKLRPEVVFPPEPLSVFSTGISDQVGNRVKIWLGDKPMLTTGKTAAGDNPFLASFFSIDFADIAAIIFSLLALIFSYDAFTREKEDGTLKLGLSNPVSRSAILGGKVFGIFLTLLPVLAFSFLTSAVLILFSKNIAFAGVDWGRISLLFIASLLYLAVFVLIGLFVSARSKTSVTSLVLCLFLWVVFAFLIPALSSNFAASFTRLQSKDNLDRVLADLDKQRDEKIRAGTKAQGYSEGYSCWWCSSGADGFIETYGNDRPGFETFRRKAMISEPIRLEYADIRWASQKAYLDGLSRQSRAARTLSFVSPSGLFRAIASAVCSTDLESHSERMDRVRRYREVFIRYFEAKNAFSSFSWITPVPPSSFQTEDALISGRTGGEFKTEKALDEWASKQKDQMARWRKLGTVPLPGDSPQAFPFLDVSDMPRFTEPPRSLFKGLEGSVAGAGLLLAEIVLLFFLGFVAFARADVR